MSDRISVIGGRYVDGTRWLASLAGSLCRIEIQPASEAITLGGALWVRLGWPLASPTRDILVSVALEFYQPAKDAPRVVLQQRQELLAKMREYRVPWIDIEHEAMVVAWLEGGPPAVVDALSGILAQRRAEGDSDEDLAEVISWQADWRAPDARMSQCLLLSGERTPAAMAAEWILAVSFAHASGGEVCRPWLPEPTASGEHLLAREQLARDLERIADESAELFEHRMPEERSFEGWDRLPADE